MAARWQQWMPFHIDRFRGSLHVQGMPGCARAGYLYLLASAWQSENCSLKNDDFELQILSGLTQKEWNQFRALILRRFVEKDGCLVNEVLRREWLEARAKYEENHRIRVEAGKKGAAKRWDSSAIAEPSLSHSSAVAKHSNNTVTVTTTERLKTSRDKREVDSRHVPFKLAVEAYAKYKGVLFAWDGGAAKQLDILLKSAPELTLADFQRCLNHRARSPGTPHGEHPKAWLPRILNYQQSPLNEYGKTAEVSNGNNGKTGQSLDAAQQAIDIIRRGQEAPDCAGVGKAGHPEAGEAGHGRLLGAG